MQATHDFIIFADYFQFIVMDEGSAADFSTVWTDEAFARMLAIGPGAMCPGTLRNVDVPVQIVVTDQEPSLSLDQMDHATEASLSISSGRLIVASCTGYGPDAARIAIPPGQYRSLFVATGISSIKTEWEPADDKYTVYLWPGSERDAKLIKHWNRNGT